MTERIFSVGDVIAWSDVPETAVARRHDNGRVFQRFHGCERYVEHGYVVFMPYFWRNIKVTLIVPNGPTNPSAADFAKLTEVFEVREALTARLGEHSWKVALGAVPVMEVNNGSTRDAALDVAAHYLHALGWRKGQAAEYAARLLRPVQVSDVVAWADVPDGAMVRRRRQDEGACEFFYYQRAGDCGWCVGGQTPDDRTYFEPMDAAGWARPWADCDRGSVTIVALNLTGQETAADLQRLAEVFEVRECLQACNARDGEHAIILTDPSYNPQVHFDRGRCFVGRTYPGDDVPAAVQAAAELLYGVGWRKGMTAEDAARLLREAG